MYYKYKVTLTPTIVPKNKFEKKDLNFLPEMIKKKKIRYFLAN